MTLLKKPESVTDGDFADGPDVMLWNPALTAKRWQTESLRMFALRCLTIRCAAGLVTLVLAIRIAETLPGALLVGAAAALVVSGLCDAAIHMLCLDIDHDHPHGRRCRLERQPDVFFLRGRDFSDLGDAAQRSAFLLIDLTRELHTTEARDWLDPELPDRAHRLAWEALACLARSRPARRHVAQLAAIPDETELASTAVKALAEFDEALDELVFHLRGCVTLTRAWEARLRHTQLAERTFAVTAELRATSIRQVADSAEELPRSCFAFVTAARDVSGAGSFPWERPADDGEPVR
ncbi:hypothetical protein [Amycolatopsis sp. WQ 127309]|uniref:hypothetical protein n=1 Tax=Amycolatopsis sp. WQ 127309 TaxID=2932773 RepID=UPI001FF1C962|nr:hypothetical protein [Amycolatopsis sp. WQ 127309]UOZ03404.1 hypothetical protein MUY22_31680 [Amycolatopsis sp. WQ 127309]